MPTVGFEPTVSAGERPKTYALDRTAIGTGDTSNFILLEYISAGSVATARAGWPINGEFYILLTVHRVVILCKWPTWLTILFYVFIYIFNSLHVSSTSCSSSGETNCVNTTSGSCRWPCRVQVRSERRLKFTIRIMKKTFCEMMIQSQKRCIKGHWKKNCFLRLLYFFLAKDYFS